ncbi:S9 family peptidase [Wukongibacter baidiensis]|uniref:alpha/beta hydrolase family protein n=1 Tax=Wukongibacter baidiensis TaxID=1723361 RepID=UPI003D7F24B9
MGNIKLDDFIKYKYLSRVKYSPDGENACFAVHRADVDENKYLSNLWLYRVKEDKYIQLTSFDQERSFIWMDDGEHILFSGMRNSKDKEKREAGEEFTQYYKININGGEAKKAFRVQKNVGTIKELDKNTFLFTASSHIEKSELYELSEEDRAKELKERKEEKNYEVLDEIPFWANGGGYTNKQRNRLFIYKVDSDKIEPLTEGHMDVEGFHLNNDRTKVIFTSMTYENKMELDSDIYIYDLFSEKLEKLSTDEIFLYDYANFINEDTVICAGKDMKGYGLNENPKFYLIDMNTKAKRCLTPELDVSMWNSVGSDCRYGNSAAIKNCGEYTYFVTTENESSYLNRVGIDGNIEKVTNVKGTVDDYDINGNDALFIGFREMKLHELYRLENGAETQITDFNGWIQKEKKVASVEHLTVETEPNVFIDGWIMKPVDSDSNKKYPAILDIHGGPKTVYGEGFFHEMQYWANEGYVVFFCNPRGSDGKGNEFADIRGKYGTIDYEDIMKFTDAVLDKCTYIDTDRVGVTGGSYGGFMTNWIIGHTDRFKAAASQRSISNWISFFGTTDIGYFFASDQCASTPWNNHEKLWEHSPMKYADRVKTPTLFIHSEEDYRCWVVEGFQMYTALKYHGVESRLCMFRGENHELSRSGKPKHRIRRLKEITDWFDKYLK